MSYSRYALGDLVRVEGGYAFQSSDFSEAGYPVVRISNIQDGHVSVDGIARIPEDKIGKGKRYPIMPGDILIAMSGATTGKIGVVPRDFEQPAYQNQRVGNFVIRDEQELNKSFLRYFLNSQEFQQQIQNSMWGVAQPNISGKQLESFMIPLPPLGEQQRIAAVLDKADALRAKRRHALARLDALLQSTFLHLFGDPVTNPMGWERMKLDNCCISIIDCPHTTPEWKDEGIICLRTSNLSKGGWDWTDTRYISEEDHQIRTKRSEIFPGDIILSREGTVGIAAIVQPGMRISMGQRLVQVRPNFGILTSEFALRFLLYELDPERIQYIMAGSTSKHLNVRDLRDMEIAVPPIKLQENFANIAVEIGNQKKAHEKALYQLDNLFHALQQRAFNGEL